MDELKIDVLNCRKICNLLKALSHPTRMTIVVKLLEGNGKKCVNDIGDMINLPQPNISQHLFILKANGIVDWVQQGKRKCYFLKKPWLIKNILKMGKNFLEKTEKYYKEGKDVSSR